MRNNLPLEESIIHKILRTTTNSQLDREDKSFAEKQLRKIYSGTYSSLRVTLKNDQRQKVLSTRRSTSLSHRLRVLRQNQQQNGLPQQNARTNTRKARKNTQ